MALVRAREHGKNAILLDCQRNANTSLFEQRCGADYRTKLLRSDIAGYAPGHLGQASAVTSGKNDCASGLFGLIEFHGKLPPGSRSQFDRLYRSCLMAC
jgi:hypothetical protein